MLAYNTDARFAGSQPLLTAFLAGGARNLAQLEASLGALAVAMTPGGRAEISALSPEPPPATDRSEEKAGFFYQGVQTK